MRVMAADGDCFSCANNGSVDLPPRERVYLGPRWRVAHAFGTSLPGWLVVVPLRHVIALDELTAKEAADLGPLLRALTVALREVLGAEKTYVALFAEGTGFTHVHFHVVPRGPDMDPGLRGPRIFGLLGGDPAGHLSSQVMDQVAADIGRAVRLGS
jgi:diadenosine tetraphosphate (Ap4A) HIT family hydrolase